MFFYFRLQKKIDQTLSVFEIRSVALRAAPGERHRTLFGIDASSEAL